MNYASIPGYTFATLADKIVVKPQTQIDVYHGTSSVTQQECNALNGLPAKGKDIDLIRHIEPPPNRAEASAFIGTVQFPVSPAHDAGAAYWAGDGGWVYHIREWPGYDIDRLLQGRIPDGKGGYRNPLMYGEQEVAIPARVPMKKIEKVGRVRMARGGPVVDWSKP